MTTPGKPTPDTEPDTQADGHSTPKVDEADIVTDAAEKETESPTPTGEAAPFSEEPVHLEEPEHTDPSATPTGEETTVDQPPQEVPPAPVETPRIARGPGFFTLLAGGVLAGAIGYGLAYYTEFRPFAGAPAEDAQAAEIASIRETLTRQAEQIAQAQADAEAAGAQAGGVAESVAALDERLTALTPGDEGIPPGVLDDLRNAARADIDALQSRMAAMDARLTEMAEQIGSVAAQVTDSGGVDSAAASEALDAYRRQLDTLQQELDAQRAAMADAEARTASLTAAAEAQQRAVLAEAALARVRAAVQGGGGFSGALAELESATSATIPTVLRDVAAGGVKSLPQLQDSFDAAARAALDAAISAQAGQGTAMERLGNFLRTQTGARSLTEREGTDPDAVLSRAQARVSEGDLVAALAELAALPEVGQAAMSGWIGDATARVNALAAVDDLAAAIGAE